MPISFTLLEYTSSCLQYSKVRERLTWPDSHQTHFLERFPHHTLKHVNIIWCFLCFQMCSGFLGLVFSLRLLSEQWNATSTAAHKLIHNCMWWRTQSQITTPAAPPRPCKTAICPTEKFSNTSYTLFERKGKNLPPTVLPGFILYSHVYRNY